MIFLAEVTLGGIRIAFRVQLRGSVGLGVQTLGPHYLRLNPGSATSLTLVSMPQYFSYTVKIVTATLLI